MARHAFSRGRVEATQTPRRAPMAGRSTPSSGSMSRSSQRRDGPPRAGGPAQGGRRAGSADPDDGLPPPRRRPNTRHVTAQRGVEQDDRDEVAAQRVAGAGPGGRSTTARTASTGLLPPPLGGWLLEPSPVCPGDGPRRGCRRRRTGRCGRRRQRHREVGMASPPVAHRRGAGRTEQLGDLASPTRRSATPTIGSHPSQPWVVP